MATRVLLIDDDRRLFELLDRYLVPHDVVLDHVVDGRTGISQLEQTPYDAVLLDVMMPGIDGLEVLRRIRSRSTVPVLMLTAKGDEADRVVGLEMGADDYISKPFSPRELLARLRAVLRRLRPQLSSERLSAGGIAVEIDTRRVVVDGADVQLTALEFDILVALLRRAGRVIPRATLLREAGRDEVVGERTVDVHISKLRRKLGDDPKHPQRIQTVRGVGYILTNHVADDAGSGRP